MPTTTKGLPYPASTAAPNVPADLQALADALDFSKLQSITAASVGGAASLHTVYPLGTSLLSIGGADTAGWPSGATLMVITTRYGGVATSPQYAYRASNTDPRVWYRLMANAGNSPWLLVTPWTSIVTLPDVAAGAVSTAAITFPANTFTGTPVVSATPVGTSVLTAGCSTTPTASGVTVYARSLSTAVTGPRVMVTANGSY